MHADGTPKLLCPMHYALDKLDPPAVHVVLEHQLAAFRCLVLCLQLFFVSNRLGDKDSPNQHIQVGGHQQQAQLVTNDRLSAVLRLCLMHSAHAEFFTGTERGSIQ